MVFNKYNPQEIEKQREKFGKLEKVTSSEIDSINNNGAIAKYSIGMVASPTTLTINREDAISTVASVFLRSKKIILYIDDKQDPEMAKKLVRKYKSELGEDFKLEEGF